MGFYEDDRIRHKNAKWEKLLKQDQVEVLEKPDEEDSAADSGGDDFTEE